MKYLLFSVALVHFSCTVKNDNPPLPFADYDCMTEKIEQFKTTPDAIAVLTVEKNGETFFFLKHLESCGSGAVYNDNCEVVCPDGKPASGAFDNCPQIEESEWIVIWEK